MFELFPSDTIATRLRTHGFKTTLLIEKTSIQPGSKNPLTINFEYSRQNYSPTNISNTFICNKNMPWPLQRENKTSQYLQRWDLLFLIWEGFEIQLLTKQNSQAEIWGQIDFGALAKFHGHEQRVIPHDDLWKVPETFVCASIGSRKNHSNWVPSLFWNSAKTFRFFFRITKQLAGRLYEIQKSMQ